MKVNKYFEFVQADFEPIKSFYIKDELTPKVWDNFEMDDEVRKQLLQIGKDFFESTDIEADVKDIVLIGSLCNYNWSEKYSDFDIHIIIDFFDIDENYELVEQLTDLAKKIWNSTHEITIRGYEVEVAIQDNDDLKESMQTTRIGGVFSIMKNKWLKKPEKVEFEPDEKLIREKAKTVMMMIDDIESEKDEDKYESFKDKIDRVWKKVKNFRKSGLESQSGEYSVGNLVFKLLRRNGYIGKVMEMKREVYDKQFK